MSCLGSDSKNGVGRDCSIFLQLLRCYTRLLRAGSVSSVVVTSYGKCFRVRWFVGIVTVTDLRRWAVPSRDRHAVRFSVNVSHDW